MGFDLKMNSWMTRRQMVGRLAGSTPLLCALPSLFGADTADRKHLGVCSYSYNLHWKAAREGHPRARFKRVAAAGNSFTAFPL